MPPCIGNAESYPLYHQEVPMLKICFKENLDRKESFVKYSLQHYLNNTFREKKVLALLQADKSNIVSKLVMEQYIVFKGNYQHYKET